MLRVALEGLQVEKKQKEEIKKSACIDASEGKNVERSVSKERLGLKVN